MNIILIGGSGVEREERKEKEDKDSGKRKKIEEKQLSSLRLV